MPRARLHAPRTLALLASVSATIACDPGDETDAEVDLSERSREVRPDPEGMYVLWQDTVDRALEPFLDRFMTTRSDDDLVPLMETWGKVQAKEVLPVIDQIAPQVITPVDEFPQDGQLAPPMLGLTDLHPCDRPSLGQLAFAECSFDQQQYIKAAYDQIHFGVWRALQRISWVLETPDDAIAAQRWNAQAPNQRTAPVEFFGTFSRARAQAVRRAYEKGWAQLNMVNEIQISCWRPPTWWEWMFIPFKATVFTQSPCSVKAAMAHTIWVGHPPLNPWVADPAYEVCPSYFSRYGDTKAPDLNSGQRSYLGAVLLHEMLHWNVVGDCGGFPQSSCTSVGPVPAYRSFLDVGQGHLKDSWPHAACDLVTDDGKCYEQEEGLAMAESDPAAAIRLPISYQYFAKAQADMYVYDHCDDIGNVCFAPDITAVACGGEPPSCGLPGGDACKNHPGIPGCACLNVDGTYLSDEAGFADGAGSFMSGAADGQYCPGEDVVCGVAQTGCGPLAACRSCGEHTNVGCPCDADTDCAGIEPNLKCWGGAESGWPHAPSGSGKCLPDASTPQSKDALEKMPWFCLDNCEATDQWHGMAVCLYNQSAYDFDHGTCVHYSSCGVNYGAPGACEEDGYVCNGNNVCGPECAKDSDCPAIGFPASYVCRAFGQNAACVPPECAGGNLSNYCSLFAPEPS